MKIKLLFFLFLCFITTTYAQQLQVSGTVISSEDNLPIIGANVLVKGMSKGTSTDFDGNFQISVEKGKTLQFSYIGFVTKSVTVTAKGAINVTLTPNSTTLNEVVVVGYGTQKKKEVTGAVAVVDSKTIEKLNPTRIDQALQGQVSGVSVTSASGSPGSATNIRIRGISTNGNNNPLILVDGNVIEDLSVINPNDIKSINVLKDATAGIYGVRAANGVILITTKSGRKESELTFNVDSYLGFQETANRIDLVSPRDYAILVNESLTNNGDDAKYLVYPETGTDWQDKVFSIAPISNINFSANGGTKKLAYAFGASYLNQDGIVGLDKSNYNRLTTTVNLQYDLLKNLKVSATGIYTHSNKNKLNEGAAGAILFNAINMNPTVPVYDSTVDGGYSLASGLGGEIINPLAQIANTYDTDKINKISATLGLDYTFLNNFTASSKFQMNHATVETDIFKPTAYYGSAKSANIITNEVYDNKDTYDDFTWDNYITYNNTFKEKHNVKVLLGTSSFKTTGEFTGLKGTNLLVNGQEVNTNNYASIANAETVTNRYTEAQLARNSNTFDTRLLSYFTRLEYNYKEKYIFSGVLRRDGSTRFGPENRFGYFPSASIGWLASDEEFLKDTPWLNSLKIRASYGVIGSDKIGDYRYLSTLSGQAIYVNNSEVTEADLEEGVAEGGLANPAIKWEQQKTANIGFDAKILNHKVSISMDAFSKKTEDLLISAQVSGLTGASAPGSAAPVINAGTVQNNGLEFQVAYNDSFSENFRFNINYNVTTLKNEVLFVASENGFEAGGGFGVGIGVGDASRMDAGNPIGYFYGYKTDGVYQNQADIDASPTTTTAVFPGDLKFVDTDKDGEITEKDRTNIGDPIADIMMGMNIGFSYKNIDFSSSLFASIGNDMVRDYERAIVLSNKGAYNIDRWTPQNTDSSIPRLSSGATTKSSYFSDFYVEDASYIRLQNIQVGYTFENTFVTKIKLEKLRLYVSANNLATFTKYKGYDPSASSGAPIGAGIDKGFYPVAKTFLLGMNLKF